MTKAQNDFHISRTDFWVRNNGVIINLMCSWQERWCVVVSQINWSQVQAPRSLNVTSRPGDIFQIDRPHSFVTYSSISNRETHLKALVNACAINRALPRLNYSVNEKLCGKMNEHAPQTPTTHVNLTAARIFRSCCILAVT